MISTISLWNLFNTIPLDAMPRPPNSRRASVESIRSTSTRRASLESILSRRSGGIESTRIPSAESQRTNNGGPSKASLSEEFHSEKSTSHLSSTDEPDSFHSIENQEEEEPEVAEEIVHRRGSDIPYHSPRLIDTRKQRLQFLLRSSFIGFLVMLLTHFEDGVIRMLWVWQD